MKHVVKYVSLIRPALSARAGNEWGQTVTRNGTGLFALGVVTTATWALLLTGAASAAADIGGESGAAKSVAADSQTDDSPSAGPPDTTDKSSTEQDRDFPRKDQKSADDAPSTGKPVDSTPAESGSVPTDLAAGETPAVAPTDDSERGPDEPAPDVASAPAATVENPKSVERQRTKGRSPASLETPASSHGTVTSTPPNADEPKAASPPDTSANPITVPGAVVASENASPPSGSTIQDVPTALRPPSPSSGPRPTLASLTAVPAATSTSESDAPRKPTLVDVIGSIALNLLVGAIHLLDGPPAVPAGSSVTVRTSRLTVPVAGGRTVQADWYFPDNADTANRLIYFQHGFLASGPMYSYTIANLAEKTGSIVVAPSLSSNFFDPDAVWVGGYPMQRGIADLFTGDRGSLTQSASDAAGRPVTLPTSLVLVGHSAGGTLVTAAAGHMVDNGSVDQLAGVVLLDAVNPNGSTALPDGLAKLVGGNDRPVYLVSSERYWLSRSGNAADVLQAARPDRFTGFGLIDGTHMDYMEGPSPLLQFASYLVGGFSHTRNIEAAKDITVGWINDLFAGTREGRYGDPGERIEVPTADGAATAVVLPLAPRDQTLFDRVLSALFDFAGAEFFNYQPIVGRSAAPAALQHGCAAARPSLATATSDCRPTDSLEQQEESSVTPLPRKSRLAVVS
ncbi:alpha/beta fold hydrolase [Mycobacterium sp. 236(2023)]|uniref:alpha/beta fold hydrolase n=1 Tax=Mycobacterium sp. 236(2023) TaxID=3038163 RepID=UPI002415083B|nr:alpha/beta fold hydrolase [Mycobacterium sp. 236(2023)]MDG4668019.1 alpha/beta fold hydrolase [Mycobacterium sp. 236(2023)]